jgi:predicted N-acetyltransferase YhbS
MPELTIATLDPRRRHDAAGLVRDAFWDLYRPGCVEHLVLELAHSAPEYPPGLELTADLDGELVGVGLATVADVIATDGCRTQVAYLGPLAAAPRWQRTCIGSALLRELLRRSAALALPGAFLYGDPGYYQRFGFTDAATWSVTTRDGASFAAFQGVELQPGALAGISGRLDESAIFEVTAEQADVFDRDFPPREQHTTATQF